MNPKLSIIPLLIIVILLASFSPQTNTKKSISMDKLDYSGTNSLFIEYNQQGMHFNWITNEKDSGYYELKSATEGIISQGKTVPNRVHHIEIEHEIEEPITFKFGSVKNEKYNVKLRPKSIFKNTNCKNIDSIYVVGDVHGRYDELVNLLQKSAVIDSNLNWIAGKANLVFLGDLFDRGNDVTKVLWFIYELEQKAKESDGKVHVVLGNHEIMVMSKDLRYLSRKEASIPIAYEESYDYLFHPKKSFLGNWLTTKASILKIDNALFAHGGIIDLGAGSINEFNEKTVSYLKEDMFHDIINETPDTTRYNPISWNKMKTFFYDEKSPFWYRGYVYSDTLTVQLKTMLKKYDSKVHIVAHTPLETITKRYNGRLLTTDLNEASTQLLLLVKKRNKYGTYKIDSSGKISGL